MWEEGDRYLSRMATGTKISRYLSIGFNNDEPLLQAGTHQVSASFPASGGTGIASIGPRTRDNVWKCPRSADNLAQLANTGTDFFSSDDDVRKPLIFNLCGEKICSWNCPPQKFAIERCRAGTPVSTA
jgi:hypothetical protein